MNNRKLETFLYSFAGVAAVFLILVAANFILGLGKARVDLTAEKLYTLSSGTKAILAKLDTPVKIRLYYTQREQQMPVGLKTYAQRVEDLLKEYKAAAKTNIEIEKYDPQPDSDAEDSANLDGVEGEQLPTGEKIYLGLAVSCLDQKVAIPFLSPDREKLLEYDLSRAIASVANPTKPVIGVMSGLPVFGQQMNPMMMRMGQGGGSPPWIFINELKRDFTVKELQLTADKIDDDVKVLVVVHPKNISEKAQFAIDQFVMRGGKLLAFLDPLATTDSQQQNPMMGMQGPSSSSLPKLLEAWGLKFDTTKVVGDLNFRTRISRGEQGRPEEAPTVLSLTPEGINADDVVTGQMDNLMMWFAGAFTGTPADGLKQTVLLKTTDQSGLVDGFMAQMSAEQSAKDLKSGGKPLALAVRLTGKFKTAFPKGAPEDKPSTPDADKDKDKKDEKKADAALTESKTETAVILVGDTDMIYDRYCVAIQNLFGQQIVIPRNANLTLVQSMIEQLSGDSSLIAVRSRATMSRPFTLVKKIQAQAEENYRAKIGEIEKSLQETQMRLGELQKNKEKGQRFILSPEQQKEVENFKKKEASAKAELKQVRKNLRQDIDALENRLKWINIAGMPLVVTFAGVGLAFVKRQRTAAK